MQLPSEFKLVQDAVTRAVNNPANGIDSEAVREYHNVARHALISSIKQETILETARRIADAGFQQDVLEI